MAIKEPLLKKLLKLLELTKAPCLGILKINTAFYSNLYLALFLTGIRESQNLPELQTVIKKLLDLLREVLTEEFEQMQKKGEIAKDIDKKIEIDNLVLLNLGQAIMQHSFPNSVFQTQSNAFVQNNIRTYAHHLKPGN